MHLFTRLWFLAVAGSFANATVPSAKTFSKCYTSRVSTSVSTAVGTASVTYTYTMPVHVTTTVTPTSTITPSAATMTSTTTTTTTTTTTLPQQTDTVTETDTETDTTTITAAAVTNSMTVTTTTTVTSTTDTTTVATAPGFTPVSGTLPNSKKKRSVMAASKRARALRDSTLFERTSSQKCPVVVKGQPPPPSYVKSVTCYKLVVAYSVSPVTKTASKTATITLKPSTATATATQSVTTTATATPTHATMTTTTTVTTTTSTTITPTISTTTTVTATQTIVQATSTYYAACGPANMVSTVGGQNIYNTAGPGDSLLTTSDSTAYDCCASCISNPFCSVAAFNTGFSSGMQCYQFLAADCTSEGEYSYQVSTNNIYVPYTVSNGNCGFINSS